jgi:two-component system chemotaxis response regulator CheY
LFATIAEFPRKGHGASLRHRSKSAMQHDRGPHAYDLVMALGEWWWLGNQAIGRRSRSSGRGRHMDRRKTLELLIVEDRQVMLKIIRRLLVQLGYGRIDEAPNGLHALEKIRHKRYDLILSDWNMDGMSGFDLLKAVRADPAMHATPFILVTAEAKRENILAAKAAGASGYLVKPFKLDEFERTLDGVLAANGFVNLAVA